MAVMQPHVSSIPNDIRVSRPSLCTVSATFMISALSFFVITLGHAIHDTAAAVSIVIR